MKLKNQLTLVVTLITAGALLVSFTCTFFLVRRDEFRALDEELRIQARVLFDEIKRNNHSLPLSFGTTFGVDPNQAFLTPSYLVLYDQDGKIISSSSTFTGEPPKLETLGVIPSAQGSIVDIESDSKPLRGVLFSGPTSKYTLLFAISRESIDKDLLFLARISAGLFLASLFCVALVARLLGGALSRDVELVAKVACEVAQGNLSARVNGIAQGSSETIALAADLDHMITKLEELVLTQRTFIAHAAHELRSPLTALRGELQLALRRPREACEYKSSIEVALADVEQLIALSQDLLTLSQAQKGIFSQNQYAYVLDVIQEATQMSKGLASEKNILIKPECQTPKAQIRGSRLALARALRNLLDNAISHSSQDTNISIKQSLLGNFIEIAVEDSGDGVSANDAPHLFAPFFRGASNQSGERPGAGLGLAITREIARSCGGDAFYDGTYQGGARFVLKLPLYHENKEHSKISSNP